MKTKTLYTALSISVLLLLSISIVTAGFLDKILGRDPDLSPVDVAVSVGNVPPTIFKFWGTTENPDDVNTPIGIIQGDAGPPEGTTGTVSVRFKFIVEDLDGPGDLPGVVSPPDGAPAIQAEDISVTFTEPLNDNAPGTNEITGTGTDCFAVECASGTNPDCNTGDFTNQKEYICDLIMNYYDPPTQGSTFDDFWTISTTIFDSTGTNSDTEQSGNSGFQLPSTANYINYREIAAISTTGGLDWLNIDINAEDQPAQSAITLSNLGNVAVVNEDVIAKDLLGVNDQNAILAAAAFSIGSTLGGSNSGACDVDAPGAGGSAPFEGTALAHNTPVTVNVDITYSANGLDTDDMHFCIWDKLDPNRLTGPSSIDYRASTSAPFNNAWEVELNS